MLKERQVFLPNTVLVVPVSCSVQDFNIFILLFEYVLLIQCGMTLAAAETFNLYRLKKKKDSECNFSVSIPSFFHKIS